MLHCHQVESSSNGLEILVKMPPGNTITIVVSGVQTIGTVKAVIQNKEGSGGIPWNKQFISFPGGEDLENSRRVSDCGIIAGSSLVVALGLDGGARKDVRRTIQKRRGDVGTRAEDQPQYLAAHVAAMSALAPASVNIKGIFGNMDLNVLEQVETSLRGKENFDVKLRAMAFMTTEYVTMTLVEEKLQHAKATLVETVISSTVEQYGRDNGTYDIERFKRDLAIIIDKKRTEWAAAEATRVFAAMTAANSAGGAGAYGAIVPMALD